MKRRDFIKNTAAGIIAPSIIGSLGPANMKLSSLTAALAMAEETDRALILIYLSGGNDGLHTLVPLDQLSALNKHRENIILPESSLLELEGTSNAFHPAFKEMKNLYEDEKLCVIQNVGYPNPELSHFRSTDIWMSGSNSSEIISSGWTGRFLEEEYPGYPLDYPNDENPDPLAIEIGWNSSMLFQGSNSHLGMTINDPDYFYELIDQTLPDAPDTKAGDQLEYIRLIAKQSQVYGLRVKDAALNVTTQSEYPDNSLAQQLKICARLIAGGLKTKLYLVEYGGFDTHDNQVLESDHTKGEHAYLLSHVSTAIDAFQKDCDFLNIGDRVMGMTFSEFGRRVVSNASLGTDHGTSAPLFVFGNHANGGILGNNPNIPDNAEWSYNLDMEFDFRQIYASLLTQWLCVPEDVVSNILFKDFEQLPLIQGTPCTMVSTDDFQPSNPKALKVFPNPVIDYAQIEFISKGELISITVIDEMGRTLMKPIRQKFAAGKHTTGFSVKSLPTGIYFIKLNSSLQTCSEQLIKM